MPVLPTWPLLCPLLRAEPRSTERRFHGLASGERSLCRQCQVPFAPTQCFPKDCAHRDCHDPRIAPSFHGGELRRDTGLIVLVFETNVRKHLPSTNCSKAKNVCARLAQSHFNIARATSKLYRAQGWSGQPPADSVLQQILRPGQPMMLYALQSHLALAAEAVWDLWKTNPRRGGAAIAIQREHLFAKMCATPPKAYGPSFAAKYKLPCMTPPRRLNFWKSRWPRSHASSTTREQAAGTRTRRGCC